MGRSSTSILPGPEMPAAQGFGAMIFTEEEAKTKWCPFARELYSRMGTFGPANRFRHHNEGYSRCIASQCMAWRWVDDEPDIGVGFCGLAGKYEQ
jgi:hypothetical protein